VIIGRTDLLRPTWVLFLGLGLTACSNNNVTDLQSYVHAVRSQQPSRIEPLPEFKPYETFLYQAGNLRSPFSQPVSAEPQRTVAGTGGGIRPDQNRPHEALEDFPLDTLRMVGTMQQKGDTWALVLASNDGTIHRLQPGNHLGQNYGKITAISEYEVALTEIVPDGLGGWMERQASLALSE
jgi:type IV pilus assembly protein PilP